MHRVSLLDGTVSLKLDNGLLLHPYNGLSELKHKYIRPISFEKLIRNGLVSILDVGFGVGYLSALVLEEIWKANSSCVVRIVGVEKNSKVVLRLYESTLVVPSHEILKGVVGGVKHEKLSVDLRIDDITLMKLDDDEFDLILYDLYPPSFCKEVWTKEVLSSLFFSLKSGGMLITHSADQMVRTNLLAVGFLWDETRAEGRLGAGTKAWKM